jgi:Domain of unknown function (DUF6268)
MQCNRLPILLVLILPLTPASAWGQTSLSLPISPETPPFRSYPVTLPLAPNTTDSERQVSGISSPMIPDPDRFPVPPASAPPQPWRLITDTKFDITSVTGRITGDVGIMDIELASTLNYNLGLAPLKVTPYFAVHFWNVGDANPFLYLYDLNVEFAWRPRLAEWLFVDLAVTPGLYTDFKHVSADSFQMRGRAAAIFAFSEQLQLVAGAMYVNRNRVKVLPAGGVIWNQSEDTRWFLVFPQPKISHRFGTVGATQIWGYVAGEFGGGRWEVERVRGVNDSFDYTDLRVILGIESVYAERLRGHLEIGYVFSRRMNFANAAADFTLPSTLMARAGFRF